MAAIAAMIINEVPVTVDIAAVICGPLVPWHVKHGRAGSVRGEYAMVMAVVRSEASHKHPRFERVGNVIRAVKLKPPMNKGLTWFCRFKKSGSLLVTDIHPLSKSSVRTYMCAMRKMGWAAREGDRLVFTGPASASWTEVMNVHAKKN